MNDGINLLISPSKPKVVEPAGVRAIRLVSISILFLIAGSAIVLFILISFSPLPSLKKDEQTLLSELSQYHPQIASITIASQRAKDLNSFLSSRKDYPEIVTMINGILPSDSRVIAISSQDKKLFDFSVESKSLASLDTVINKLDLINLQKKTFTKAKMVSLALSDDLSSYVLKIEFVLL